MVGVGVVGVVLVGVVGGSRGGVGMSGGMGVVRVGW